LGGHERRLTTFGFYPRWSPDGSRVLFTGAFIPTSIYVVALDGTPPREIGQTVTNRFERLWATWHPDGKRISIWGLPKVPKEKDYSTYRVGAGVVEFWTFSLDQGTAIRSELAPNVEQRYRDEGLDTWVFDFTWRPSADAVFFSAGSRGVRNIWKVTVDPASLRWTGGPERLTTGAGDDRWVAISGDGRKLAFNAESDVSRLWSFRFDAVRGELLDQGEPLTPADAKPTGVALNANGSRVAFVIAKRGERSSRTELTERVFASSTDHVLIADGHSRYEPRWSPDSRLLVYNRESLPTILDTTSGLEQPLRDSKEMWLGDWSPDGHSIIGVTDGTSTTTNEMWTVPVNVDDATARPRMVAGNAQYRVYQPMFSPDGRWICFNGVKGSDYRTSTLFVMSSSGGPWIQLTDGHYWDDVPRWAPDGTAIYFLSTRSRGGPAFDIWGLRFDPVRGLPKGESFQVSSFQVSPDRDDRVILIQDQLMAIGRDRLIVTMWNVSGNIWVLEEP